MAIKEVISPNPQIGFSLAKDIPAPKPCCLKLIDLLKRAFQSDLNKPENCTNLTDIKVRIIKLLVHDYIDSGKENFIEAEQIIDRQRLDDEIRSVFLEQIATGYRLAGKNFDAERVALLIPDFKKRVYALRCTAKSFTNTMEALPKAFRILAEAKNAALRIFDPYDRCSALSDIAKDYIMLGNVDKATEILMHAEKVAQMMPANEPLKDLALKYLVENYKKAGNISKANELIVMISDSEVRQSVTFQ
jgi:hypothetical protein